MKVQYWLIQHIDAKIYDLVRAQLSISYVYVFELSYVYICV